MSDDHARFIQRVAEAVEESMPALVDDSRIPVHVLKRALRHALVLYFGDMMQEQPNGPEAFVFLDRIADQAVDALMIARGRAS